MRAASPDKRLVLISGSVASGKTPAALRLAALARRHGRRAASIDMDEFVEMIAGEDWSRVLQDDRLLAAQLASTVIAKLFEEGISFVAVAGSTLASYEWDNLLETLDADLKPFYVLLRVSNEEAVRRAQGDPFRIHTKDPAFVAELAARIDWSAVRQQHVDLQTDGLTTEEVARIISRAVFDR